MALALASQRSAASELSWLVRSVEAFALTVFVVLFYIIPDGATPWVLLTNLAVFYVLLVRAIAVPDRIVPRLPSYFSIEVMFLAYSYLVFYYPYQLMLFGATDLSVSKYVTNSFVGGSNKAITLATIGMIAFSMGYRILAKATPDAGGVDGDRPKPERSKQLSSQRFHALATASSVLLFTLVTIFVVAGWRSEGEGRYTGTTTGGLGIEGISLAILMFCMIVAALWVYALAVRIPQPPLLIAGLLLAIAWSLRLILLGDRNSFLLFALVLVGGYFTFVRRASFIVVAVSFSVWLVFYQMIEVLRLTPNWYRSSSVLEIIPNSRYYQGTSGDSSFNVTTIAVRATVEVVPSAHDFMYGAFKLIQLSSAIPFSARFFLPSLDPNYTSSSQLLGDILLGHRATWSPGTNVISDSYIDFGVAGVVVLLFGTGLLAKAIRNHVARDPYDVQRVVMYLLTMATIAELPRYAIELPIRILFWAFIFSIVIGAVARHIHTRSEPRNLVQRVPEKAGR